MKKLLTVLGAVSLAATVGSTVVSCTKEAKKPNLQALKAQIEKAEKIQQGKKTKTAFEALKQAILEAKKVKKEEDVSKAYAAIVKAMKAFNDSADMKVVDFKNFKENAEKETNKKHSTIDAAVTAIQGIAKPEGVKTVKVEKDKDGKNIIVTFVVEERYNKVEKLELTFVKAD
ncbi:hypothetical protein CXP39_02210 [Mesoplasma syrphidae]|uniref:Lipoprotein n=1 Tax=Mesoplasma syrphidae TaxID=225999 RepID=A0A2K9C999_9MOLU|nr:lipoprotein [Mesoplasma syrphidae]AUF83605.1 hypothetical protein CXP39_02210 [Mesoplasma syrphidae]